MVGKLAIVEALGESALLLPSLLSAALSANDRLKIRLSLLQEAAARANGQRGGPDFAAERRSVGLDDADYGELLAGARPLDGQIFVAPGAEKLAQGFGPDLDAMLAPLVAAGAEEAASLKHRLDLLRPSFPAFADDRVAEQEIRALASARRDGADSLHLLVMDLHRALNRLAAATAVEEISGAQCSGLDDVARARVRAFMSGLNRTKILAFGHPGLDATAGMSGKTLVIQNDIGTTDAHVLVVHVDDLTASVTYTDVHRARAKFFIAQFSGFAVEWSPLAEKSRRDLAQGEVFYLIHARFPAPDAEKLDAFLAFLGSRLVFLIDWNKARKTLQNFVGKSEAIALLSDAAEADHGHRAFLELGGAELVYEAVRNVGAGRIAYGVPLEQALGAADCIGFLAQTLRACAQGLKDGRSTRLIRDEIQTELAARLGAAERALLMVALRHLGLTRMLAGLLDAQFSSPRLPPLRERQALASRAKNLEAKADRLTVEARACYARLRDAQDLSVFVEQIEAAMDCLDEAGFLASLAADEADSGFAAPLGALTQIVVEALGALISALEAALLLPEGKRRDAAFALERIDAVVDAERAADIAERAAFAALFSGPPPLDPRLPALGLEIARALEDSTDRLAHAAMALRARLLQELSA